MSDNPRIPATDVIASLQSHPYPVEERLAILRALIYTIPGLVAVDPALKNRIRTAMGVRPENIDVTITALENSEVWQQSAGTTPDELREHRVNLSVNQPLIDELRASAEALQESSRYHQYLGVSKSRKVYNAGKSISGEAALTVKPHLERIAETRPTVSRKRKKGPDQVPLPPSKQ